MISVYENSNGFRVVAGAHIPAAEHRKLAPRVYRDATAAHRIETNPRIRAALVTFGAVVDGPQHIVVKGNGRRLSTWDKAMHYALDIVAKVGLSAAAVDTASAYCVSIERVAAELRRLGHTDAVAS